MRLLRARFENFRLLRDIELDFGSDSERSLTVVRAANESGKTTLLHALQWALYGDDSLPASGEGFRLHPIDWNVQESSRVTITGTVDFEVTSHRRAAGKIRETRRIYRLVRSAVEEVQSSPKRLSSTVKLFEIKEAGASPIQTPDSWIRSELPPELREVFFTDGDRALSFIEADVAVSTKRDRVQRAIRSLLGLGVIGDALKHVRNTKSAFNKRAKAVDRGGRLDRVATRLDAVDQDERQLQEDLEDVNQQFDSFDARVRATHKKIDAALQKGDKEQLARDLRREKTNMERLDKQIGTAKQDHARLFRSSSAAIDLVAPVLQGATARLDQLRLRGKIPNTTIPVLEGRLEAGVCICGESLDAGNPEAASRRTHITSLIDKSRRADQVQEIVTSLYYGARELSRQADSSGHNWSSDYKKVVSQRDTLEGLRDEAGRKYRSLEAKLDDLPSTDIQGLRETQRRFGSQRDRCLAKRAELVTRLEGLKEERGGLERERDRLLRAEKTGARVVAGLEVTQDVETVLRSAYERITGEEVAKVSSLMNRIFLEMIGADPEQGAIIRRAEINSQFDIVVYGPSDRMLNPDRDLNGASRRALTLAFILALTKVSEVVAPNVIDTPLGMTSGFVKRSILRTAVRESAQLILFLTHDEIAGCEDIIDQTASVVFTLTNPAHYPRMLLNDPGVEERKVLRCECNHRSSCALCERRLDIEDAGESGLKLKEAI